MQKLELKLYPDAVLRKKCEPIEEITGEIKELIPAMLATMQAKNGIGLAAPQIGISKQIIVVGAIPKITKPFGLINPKITKKAKKKGNGTEGCLSIPGIYAEVPRPEIIEVSGITPEGKKMVLEVGGLFARVLQHEIDHLSGILFPDRLNTFQRIRTYRKYQQELTTKSRN